jgi:hypothetical protein
MLYNILTLSKFGQHYALLQYICFCNNWTSHEIKNENSKHRISKLWSLRNELFLLYFTWNVAKTLWRLVFFKSFYNEIHTEKSLHQ